MGDLPRGAVSVERYDAVRNRGGRTVFDFSSFRRTMLGGILDREPTEEQKRQHMYAQFLDAINTICNPPPVREVVPEHSDYLSFDEKRGRFIIDNDAWDLDAIVIDTFRCAPEDFVGAPDRLIDAFFFARKHISDYIEGLKCMSFETDPYYFPEDLIIPDGGDMYDGSCVSAAVVESFDGYDSGGRYINFRMVMYSEPDKGRFVYQVSADGAQVPSQVLLVGVVTGPDDRLQDRTVYESWQLL